MYVCLNTNTNIYTYICIYTYLFSVYVRMPVGTYVCVQEACTMNTLILQHWHSKPQRLSALKHIVRSTLPRCQKYARKANKGIRALELMIQLITHACGPAPYLHLSFMQICRGLDGLYFCVVYIYVEVNICVCMCICICVYI